MRPVLLEALCWDPGDLRAVGRHPCSDLRHTGGMIFKEPTSGRWSAR
jgi:hypothetical protein